jgi:hypothetical protein
MPAPRSCFALRTVASIDVRGWDEIWRLTCRFYDAERPYVERRLKANQYVAQLRTVVDQRLVGMAALETDVFSFEGRGVVVVFSSHAIVEDRFRSRGLLRQAGLRCLLRTWLEHPLKHKFWAFDTAGDHSEKLVPWPPPDRLSKPWQVRLLAAYGERKFGSAWLGGGALRAAPQKRLLLAPYAGSVSAPGSTGQLRLVPLGWANTWALLRGVSPRPQTRQGTNR